jgi:putative acetyltransferase
VTASFNLIAYRDELLPGLTNLWVAAWNQAMPAIDFAARRDWFANHLNAMRDGGVNVTCAFDASCDGLAGFITLDPLSGHIDQIAVAPRYWSTGAGDALIDHAKNSAPAVLRLEVNQDNPRAVRFYERHGFHRRAASLNPNSGLKTWRYEWKP